MWRDRDFIAGWFDGIDKKGLADLKEAWEKRNLAREAKNYKLADDIRLDMKEKYGVTVMDTKSESYWLASIETYRKFYKPYR